MITGKIPPKVSNVANFFLLVLYQGIFIVCNLIFLSINEYSLSSFPNKIIGKVLYIYLQTLVWVKVIAALKHATS